MLDSFSVFRVRLGYLSSFLSTSCITSLHFIPDSDEGKWYFSVIDFRLYFHRLPIPVFHPRGWGGGGSLLFGPYGYVPLNRVWFSRSWVLHRVYNFTIKRLEQGVVLDWKPFKECQEQSTFAVPIFFALIYISTILVWKLLNLVCNTKQIRVRK